MHDSVLGIEVEPINEFSTASSQAADGYRHALFWGATWLCRVKLDAPTGWGDLMKKRRRDASPVKSSQKQKQQEQKSAPKQGRGEGAGTDGFPDQDADARIDEDTPTNFKLITRYRPILRAGFLGPRELVVVERPLVDVLRTLPPAFFKPRYGS